MKPFSKGFHFFLVFLLLLNGCSSRTHEKSVRYSGNTLSEEVALGQQIHAEILSSFYLYSKPEVVRYVNDIGASLVQHVERRDLNYQFTLLYNDKIYASSAPGGYVYVTTGMVNFLQSEAEFAAVLAHEIAELQYRDPNLSEARKVMSEMTRTGAGIAPAFGQIGVLAMLGLMMVHAALEAQVQTPEQRIQKADRLAMEYLVHSGYDPQSLFDVLKRFLEADQKWLPYFYEYYQSRPISQGRVMMLQKKFSELSLDNKNLMTKPQIYQEITKPIREMYRQ